jgi:hypothetical protein
MSKFNSGDKVVVSRECKDEQYVGISGTVIQIYPWTDGQENRVCLDKPVNNACVFWFDDYELIERNGA